MRILRAVLIATLALASTGADQVARLEFDLEAPSLTVHHGDSTRSVPLDPGDLDRFRQFRSLLALGKATGEEAHRLGARLLGPVAEVLRSAPRWEVSPPDIAPLSALALEPEARPLLHDHLIWYTTATRAQVETVPGSGSILMVAPFTPGIDSLDDDPYDLLTPVRQNVRRVALIPRNDTTPERAVTVVREEQPSLLWLRATPSVGRPYVERLLPPPALLWWSRADDERPGERIVDLLATTRAWSEAGGTIYVDLWPVTEVERAAASRLLIRALVEEGQIGDALWDARRTLAASGEASLWAGWILVGDPHATVSLTGPSWWQRLLQR